jgi:truncated hemoglobin YjbI
MRARALTATVVLVGAGLSAGAGERPMVGPAPLTPDQGLTLHMPRGAINAFQIPGTALMVFSGPGVSAQPPAFGPKGGQPPAKGAKTAKAALDPAEIDKRVARIVYDAAAVGTDLWNLKNYEGTFRLYQGTVAAVVPFLDHHPKLAELGLNSLRKSANMAATDGAFVLREAMDAIQKETAAALTKSLWDRLGGEKAVRAVVKDFVADAAQKDGVLTRGGTVKPEGKDLERLEQALVEAISEQTGGPLKPTGMGLARALAGTKLTEGAFVRLQFALGRAMVKNKVPDAESKELVETLIKLKPNIVGQ